MCWEGRSFGKGICAPLLLARDTIVVAVHLDVRTVSQEERSFRTGSHLRTVGATIAANGRRSSRIARLGGNCGLWSYAARIFTIAVEGESHDNDKWNDATEETWLLRATTRR